MTPQEPLRILIVDDEPAHAEAVRRALLEAEAPMAVEVVHSLQGLRQTVATHTPHLVLLDLLLPDGRADAALVSPPESGPFPMVVMTSHGDEQAAVASIRKGALDYVVKSPAAFANMPRTVERALREWRALQENRQARQALQENERVLRMALETGRIGAFELDLASGRATWSSVVSEIWGIPEGFAGNFADHCWRHVHPEDLERVRRFYAGFLEQSREQECEFRVVRPGGTTCWLRWRGRVIPDQAGTGRRVVGVNLDITDARRSGEALRESQHRLQMALEGARMGVWEYDFRTDRLYWSPEIFRNLGVPQVEPTRALMARIIHPDDRALPQAAMDKAIAGSGLYHCEYRIVLHGRTQWVDDRGQVIRDETGRPLKAVGTAQDITERKGLESQLRQAQKLEAVGQLAGGVAHDFNNILGAILMQLGLLEMDEHLDPELAHSLADLKTEAQRAASVTRQLLMFSRRSVMETRSLDLNEVVGGLLKMLGRLIGEQVKLVFSAHSGFLPAVSGDAGMLEQVVMNLVVNARDAMPHGGSVTLGTAVCDFDEASLAQHPGRKPGRFVCLSVADTGIGMDDATLKRIFEPFFTTKEPGKGTGLGLATVHGIVAQHHGWVEVSTTVGHGTLFRVFLPAATEAASRPADDVPNPPPQRGTGTLLFVEDEDALRNATSRILRALGYRVHAAENGRQAVALWQEHGPEIDLLFTDMVMPEGMTGIQLAGHLRDLKPDLKVIISSGYSAEIARTGVITQEGFRYLPKPYPAQVLADLIRSCLAERPPAPLEPPAR